MVAKRNDLESGVKIMAEAKAICDVAHAVVIAIRLLRADACCEGILLESRVSALSTRKGRNSEPANDIKENSTRAREPFLAMSATTSFEPFNSPALLASSW